MENEQGALAQSTDQVSPAQSPQQPVDQQEAFNKAVPAIKQKAYEKGYQDAESKTQQVGLSSQDMERWKNEILVEATAKAKAEVKAETEQAQAAQWQAQWRADLESKVSDAKTRYEDYDTVVTDRFVKTAPQVVALTQMFANAGDMLYELAKPENRALLAETLQFSKSDDITYAQENLQQLSDSIKNNQTSSALKAKMPPKPFARVTPSELNLNSGKPVDLYSKGRATKF